MISSELNKMLVNKFPHLQEKYMDEVSWQEGDDTGSHTVYGDVLTPYLVDCILQDKQQELGIIFDFLENLLEIKGSYVDEVVCFSVFESIAYIFKEKTHLITFLGEKCKNTLNEVV